MHNAKAEQVPHIAIKSPKAGCTARNRTRCLVKSRVGTSLILFTLLFVCILEEVFGKQLIYHKVNLIKSRKAIYSVILRVSRACTEYIA